MSDCLPTLRQMRDACLAFSAFLISGPVNAAPAFELSVRPHSNLKTVRPDDVAAVMAEAQKILSSGCQMVARSISKTARVPNTRRCEIQLSLSKGMLQEAPSSFETAELDRLRRWSVVDSENRESQPFDKEKILAAQEELASGVYSVHAINALFVLAIGRPGLEVHLVPEIRAGCDRDLTRLEGFWAKGRASSGCGGIGGNLLILQMRPMEGDRMQWVQEHAALLAHELGHIAGLQELEKLITRILHPPFKQFPIRPDEATEDYWARLLKGFLMVSAWPYSQLLIAEEWHVWEHYPAESERLCCVEDSLADRKYLEMLVKRAARYQREVTDRQR